MTCELAGCHDIPFAILLLYSRCLFRTASHRTTSQRNSLLILSSMATGVGDWYALAQNKAIEMGEVTERDVVETQVK